MKCFAFLDNVKYEQNENVLSELEIETFEKANNISLPEDYRFFLTNIGNGIRIFMPNGSSRYITGIRRSKLKKHYKFLGRQFLFDAPFLKKDNHRSIDWFEDCLNVPYDDDNEEICKECKHFERCPFAVVDSYNEYDYPYYSGAFPICSAGCTYLYHLILTGNHRGEVWLDNALDDFIPMNSSFADFLEWVANSKCY